MRVGMNRYRGLAVPVRGILRGLNSLGTEAPHNCHSRREGTQWACDATRGCWIGSEIRTGRQDTGGRQGGRVPSNMLVGSWLATTQKPPDWRARQCVWEAKKSLPVPNARIWRFWPSPKTTGYIQVNKWDKRRNRHLFA